MIAAREEKSTIEAGNAQNAEDGALVVFQPSLLSSLYEPEKAYYIGGCIDREIRLAQVTSPSQTSLQDLL